jgi:murein hydrolase activator
MIEAARPFALACIVLLGAAGPTTDDVRQTEAARANSLKAQETARAKAAAASAEEDRLGQSRVAAAERLRQIESALADDAARVAALRQRQQDVKADIDTQSAKIAHLLPMIARLSRYPAETMLVLPQSPEDSVRGLLILKAVTRDAGEQAAGLHSEQVKLAAVGQDLAAAQADLSAQQARQQSEAAALDTEIAAARLQRGAAETEAADWARKAAEQAARAATLRQAIARIEEAARAEAARQTAKARQEAAVAMPGLSGGLRTPVAGPVVQHFGDTVDGAASSAVLYQPPPAARVQAPCASRVVFAGPFRSYGLLAILDCGGGYHAVLSGFDRLDVALGQTLRQGEPMGVMPGGNALDSGRKPALNFELRKDGQAIDPAPLLRAAG